MTMTQKMGHIPTIYTEDTMVAIVRSVDDKIDNQRQPRRTASACYICRKPKGPVRKNTLSVEVATPTCKRGFFMSEFIRCAPARAGMVYGHGGGYPQGRPHGYGRVLNHHAHPLRVRTQRVAFQSLVGAETMTQVIPLVRTAAPIQSRHADTSNPEIIALHAAAENALSMALAMLRNPSGSSADLERATARACRAATLLKRACAAKAEGSAV